MDSHLLTLQVRKLRKKLRQIENLESLERELSDDEISKCLKKDGLREELLSLLSQINEEETSTRVDEDFNSSCSVSTDWSHSKSVTESDVSFKLNQSNIIKTESSTASNPEKIEIQEHVLSRDNNVKEKTELNKQKEADDFQSSSKTVEVQKEKVSYPNSQSSPTKKGKTINKGSKDNRNGPNSKTVFWDTSGFIVNVLEGHNDLVTAVDCNGPIFVSASRDTTIKVWDFKTQKEVKSLGSHTGSVTTVALVSVKELGSLGQTLGLKDDDFLVLSGSVDCSLNLWSAKRGELLKSIYTYNPITKVKFHPDLACAVTTSDGGKLEFWDLDTKDNIATHKAHDEAITGLVVQHGKIFTSSAVEGEIKVFEIRERNPVCLFASENIHLADGKSVYLRHIRSLNVKGDNLYYGDDGVNLKILSWRKGLVKKVPNHKEDFGMTDAVCINGDTMISSAFDLDTGTGYLNAFDIADEPVYLATLNNEDSGRILDIACSYGESKYVTIVTAGTELQVWRQVPKSSDNSNTIPTKFEPTLCHSPIDSDLESDVEFSESDSEHGPSGSRRGSSQAKATSSWMSWCSLM